MVPIVNMNQIVEVTKSFEDLKHVDEDGNIYWDAKELSKAMGYSRFRNFEPAINRAKQAIINNGKNPDNHMADLRHMVTIGSSAQREVNSYKLDRYAAYSIAMNADPSKLEVAIAQEYFLQNTFKAEAIEQRLKDKATIETRNLLSDANKNLASTLLTHGVKESELGIVANAGDKGFFDMDTKKVKELKGIPNNKPVADMMGTRVAAYKYVAQLNTEYTIEKDNANGVDETSDIAYNENRDMRNLFENKFGSTPEDSMTLEDSKKVERRYNKITDKQLRIMEG